MWWFWTIALNGLVGLGAYGIARHAFGQPRGWPRALAATTLAWAWITVGLETLGSFELIARVPLLLWAALGAAIGLAFRMVRPGRTVDPAGATNGSDPQGWEPEATLALGLVIWAALTLGLPSLLFGVKVVSDGPIYHLYFAARWWKEGRLSLIPTPFGETAAPYFPAVGDLWFTWLTTAWGGDRLARVGQAPFLLAAGCAAAAIARRLGARLPAAVIATSLFVTATPMFLFSFEPNVDTIFIAGYLIAGYFFLRFACRDDGTPALVLGGLAAGGALGTKAPAVVFVPLLLVLASVPVVRRGDGMRAVLGRLAAVWLCPLVMAGYWYGRNAWLTGNPLYPLHVTVFGRTLLAGWYSAGAMRYSRYYLPASDWRSGGDLLLAVLDPRLVPLWAAALAGAWMAGKRDAARDRWVWASALLAVLNLAAFWVLIPYRTQQRFMLQAVGLAAIPLAVLLDRARVLRVLAVALLALHLFTPEPWPFATREDQIPWDLSPKIPNMVSGLVSLPAGLGSGRASPTTALNALATGFPLILGAGALAAGWTWARAIRRPGWRRGLAAAALTSAVAAAAGAFLYPWDVSPRWLFYPPFPDYNAGWAELERLSPPGGTRVAYAGTNLPYYLMCYGLRNDVRYVNIDAHPAWRLHDYHREARRKTDPTWPTPRPGWDRIHPDYAAWLANLRAEGIQLMVVARANPAEGPFNVNDRLGFPIERQWAEEHPESFTPVYGAAEHEREFRIYRVKALPEQ